MADLQTMTALSPRDTIPVGVPGLDEILAGGLTRARLYLLEGTPGTGKTTLGLQFLLEGVARGEKALYVTLSESADELRASAASHGWSLDGLELYELVNEMGLDPDSEQSVLHPSEVELGETVREVIARIDDLRPDRVVFDSLSELRLLAQNPLRYRRQILALKQMFAARGCTVIMLDDGTADTQLHSIAHGVIVLEQSRRGFGAARRRLHVLKMRGVKFHGGMHDFTLDTGGVEVFPSLVADDHGAVFSMAPASTGSRELDALLGGGLVPATNTLLLGPSGVGKTTTAIRCMLEALERGQRASYFLFDEGRQTMLARARSLGMSLDAHLASGALIIDEIEPAEFSPGEFACRVRRTVERGRQLRRLRQPQRLHPRHARRGIPRAADARTPQLPEPEGGHDPAGPRPARGRRRRALRHRPQLSQRRHPAVPLLRGEGRGPHRPVGPEEPGQRARTHHPGTDPHAGRPEGRRRAHRLPRRPLRRADLWRRRCPHRGRGDVAGANPPETR